MAQQDTETQTCGSKKITYPKGSTFVCVCSHGKCKWTVILDGGTIVTGEGMVAEPNPRPPHVRVSGELGAIATALQKIWKGKLVVPRNLRARTIRARTLRGTPERILGALGIAFESKPAKVKRSKSRRKRAKRRK